MDKITFVNGQQPALNATNLNQLQTNVEAAISAANTYSTDETVIGTWIDKPLYRKVFDIGSLPSSYTKTITTGFTSIIKCRKLYGIAYGSAPSAMYAEAIPYNDGTQMNTIIVNINSNGDIRVTTSDDMSAMKGFVVVEYIKTTD